MGFPHEDHALEDRVLLHQDLKMLLQSLVETYHLALQVIQLYTNNTMDLVGQKQPI